MSPTVTLDVEVATDPACFLLPEWGRLAARDRPRNVFAGPVWNRVWWQEFGAGKELIVLTVRRDGEVVGLVPLYRRPDDGVLRFVGGTYLTDYLGPICSSDDAAEVAGALVHWLETTSIRWSELDAHFLPVPFGFAESLAERADRSGFRLELEQEETSAVLLLSDDWDAYLEALDSKDRHELRRKLRRFDREHPHATFRTATAETLERDLEVFVDMHRGAPGGDKGDFMDPQIVSFFVAVAHAFMPLGWLRLDVVEIGGAPVASTFGFEVDGVFYLYNSAYEPDHARLSPGLVLVSELIRGCIERGLDRFDFLRGPERYKYAMGAKPLPLHRVRVLRDHPIMEVS